MEISAYPQPLAENFHPCSDASKLVPIYSKAAIHRRVTYATVPIQRFCGQSRSFKISCTLLRTKTLSDATSGAGENWNSVGRKRKRDSVLAGNRRSKGYPPRIWSRLRIKSRWLPHSSWVHTPMALDRRPHARRNPFTSGRDVLQATRVEERVVVIMRRLCASGWAALTAETPWGAHTLVPTILSWGSLPRATLVLKWIPVVVIGDIIPSYCKLALKTKNIRIDHFRP